jgi:hypothetical protein
MAADPIKCAMLTCSFYLTNYNSATAVRRVVLDIAFN